MTIVAAIPSDPSAQSNRGLCNLSASRVPADQTLFCAIQSILLQRSILTLANGPYKVATARLNVASHRRARVRDAAGMSRRDPRDGTFLREVLQRVSLAEGPRGSLQSLSPFHSRVEPTRRRRAWARTSVFSTRESIERRRRDETRDSPHATEIPRGSTSIGITFFETVLAAAAAATAVTDKDGEARAQTTVRSITCPARTNREQGTSRLLGCRGARGCAAHVKLVGGSPFGKRDHVFAVRNCRRATNHTADRKIATRDCSDATAIADSRADSHEAIYSSARNARLLALASRDRILLNCINNIFVLIVSRRRQLDTCRINLFLMC